MIQPTGRVMAELTTQVLVVHDGAIVEGRSTWLGVTYPPLPQPPPRPTAWESSSPREAVRS